MSVALMASYLETKSTQAKDHILQTPPNQERLSYKKQEVKFYSNTQHGC